MNDNPVQTNIVLERIEQLAAISEEPGQLTRTYGSKAFVEACSLVRSWMLAAGLETRVDNIGNVRGRLNSPVAGARTFVMASHIDTVVNAGKFDGPLGVVLAIEAAAYLSAQSQELPFHLEVIAFCDEEGVRFHTTYLGSKAVTGALEHGMLNRPDVDGITLEEHIRLLGGDSGSLAADAIPATEWLGYFEIHIEQGPVLWRKDVPVALVTGIAGQTRVGLIFSGEAGHAGTVPMAMRKDALCGAAEFITEVEKFAIANNEKVVATVGKLDVEFAASNVIPAKITCSLDLRSPDAMVLRNAGERLRHIAENICRRRKLLLNWIPVQETQPVVCNQELNVSLSQSITQAGYPVLELVSGAGHDAVPISAVAPVAMLFVRCFEGISHNPLENVEAKDIAAALKTSRIFMDHLIGSYKPVH